MKPPAALHRELDLWAANGRRLPMWWRDDGARTASKPLDRLLSMARRYETPLTLAAIPDDDAAVLAARLACERQVVVIHGDADPRGAGSGAPEKRLAEGRAKLGVMPRFAPVFALPSKTVHPDLVGALRARDYRGLSGFGQDLSSERGLTRVDVHLDLMDEATGSGFPGDDLFMSRFLKLARDRRRAGDWDQPIGVLTRHPRLDEAAWRFFDAFLDRMTASPAVRWKSINDLLGSEGEQRVIRMAPTAHRATSPARLDGAHL